jgi:beta-glucanase (GH16 family)
MDSFNKYLLGIVCLMTISSCAIFQKANKYQLVWADEFNYEGYPDENKWSYDLGNGCPNCNWGNNENQYYTNGLRNAKVENGQLIINAIKEDIYTYHYTSSRLITKYKGDWKYGKIEVRAKLPAGRGIWPAIWMLPTDWEYGGWPESGEIDIMEFVGYQPDSIYGSAHSKTYYHSIGTQKTKGLFLNDTNRNYHTYGITWDENTISFTVDGKSYFKVLNEKTGFKAWPFDKRFHLLLNVAVGGFWGGAKGIDDTIFPQRMEVDYVRVYQKNI